MNIPPDDRLQQDPVHTLESVRHIQPRREAADRAIHLALRTAAAGEAHEQPCNSWNRFILRSGVAAAMLLAVGVIGWLGLTNSRALATPSWDDVLSLSAGIDTYYIDMHAFQDGNPVERGEMWVQSPGRIRVHEYESVEGQLKPTECSIATPEAAVRWDQRTRLAEITTTDNPYMVQSDVAHHFDAIIGASFLVSDPEAKIKINDEQVEFHPAGQSHPADPSLRGFKLHANDLALAIHPPFDQLIYWFDRRANTLRRVTTTQVLAGESRYIDMAVAFAPPLPAGWFDPVIPDGYFDADAGVGPRLADDVKAVYDQIAAARQQFGDYRAVIGANEPAAGRRFASPPEAILGAVTSSTGASCTVRC